MNNMYLIGAFANYSVKPNGNYTEAIKKKLAKVVIYQGHIYAMTKGKATLTNKQLDAVKKLHARKSEEEEQPDA